VSNTRQAVLDACVAEVGRAWVVALRDELKKEGRAMRGGWPGTKAEGRSRVLAFVERQLARLNLRSATPDEIARLSREVYAAARRAWLAEAESGD
jgi:hypothetical protein